MAKTNKNGIRMVGPRPSKNFRPEKRKVKPKTSILWERPKISDEWKHEVRNKWQGKCAICGSTENLQCHHIVPVHRNPQLREDPENGLLLCEKCHQLFHPEKFQQGHRRVLPSQVAVDMVLDCELSKFDYQKFLLKIRSIKDIIEATKGHDRQFLQDYLTKTKDLNEKGREIFKLQLNENPIMKIIKEQGWDQVAPALRRRAHVMAIYSERPSFK